MAGDYITVPTDFQPNTKAKSAEVDANFAAIVDGLDGTTPKDISVGHIARNANSISSANYTVLDNDTYGVLLFTTGASTRTCTLPTAANNTGREITIVKVDSGAGFVTVDGEGAETINGKTTYDLYVQYDRVTLVCDGTGWFVLEARHGWVSFDATITGTGSNPSKATSPSLDNAYWRRKGKNMELFWHYEGGATGASAGSGNYLLTIPNSLNLDTTIMPTDNSGGQPLGQFFSFDPSSSLSIVGWMAPDPAAGTTGLAGWIPTSLGGYEQWSATRGELGGSTGRYGLWAVFPISEWA